MTDADLMGIPLEDLLKEIEAPVSAPDPGEAYLTPEQWAATWGCSYDRAQHAISKLVTAGRMEVAQREVLNRIGHRCRKPVYRLVDKKVGRSEEV